MPSRSHREAQHIWDPGRTGMYHGFEQPGIGTRVGQGTVNAGFATGHAGSPPKAVPKQPSQGRSEIRRGVEGLRKTQRPTQPTQGGESVGYFQGRIHYLVPGYPTLGLVRSHANANPRINHYPGCVADQGYDMTREEDRKNREENLPSQTGNQSRVPLERPNRSVKPGPNAPSPVLTLPLIPHPAQGAGTMPVKNPVASWQSATNVVFETVGRDVDHQQAGALTLGYPARPSHRATRSCGGATTSGRHTHWPIR